jgi:hypothetical protein
MGLHSLFEIMLIKHRIGLKVDVFQCIPVIQGRMYELIDRKESGDRSPGCRVSQLMDIGFTPMLQLQYCVLEVLVDSDRLFQVPEKQVHIFIAVNLPADNIGYFLQ